MKSKTKDSEALGPASIFELIIPNNNSKYRVFNKEFKDWESHIDYHIRKRDDYENDYTSKKDARLLKLAKEHAFAYEKSTEAPSWITLTHPFYVFLTHGSELKSPGVKADARSYLDVLTNLLTSDICRDRANIVIFETLHHYAAATSRLLEQGLVDKVVFTHYDTGHVLDCRELKKGNQDYYSGGGYNGRCFKHSLSSMKNVVDTDQISIVTDLVIDSPEDRSDGLMPKKIETPRDEAIKSITLAELYNALR